MTAVQKLLATFQPSVDYAKERYGKAHGAVVVGLPSSLRAACLHCSACLIEGPDCMPHSGCFQILCSLCAPVLQSNPRYAGVYKNLANTVDKVSSTVSLLKHALLGTCADLCYYI